MFDWTMYLIRIQEEMDVGNNQKDIKQIDDYLISCLIFALFNLIDS